MFTDAVDATRGADEADGAADAVEADGAADAGGAADSAGIGDDGTSALAEASTCGASPRRSAESTGGGPYTVAVGGVLQPASPSPVETTSATSALDRKAWQCGQRSSDAKTCRRHDGQTVSAVIGRG